jgi:ADP-heptose:LPS heptosyltransferase
VSPAAGAGPLLLVLRALGLGDLLTAVPALRALAAAFPHHRRVLAAPAALAPLAILTGALDEVLDTGPLQPLPEAARRADVAVNLHGRGPQSTRLLLATRPRRLLAFGHPEVPGSDGEPCWRAGEHEVGRWCRLLAASGIRADPADLDLAWPPPGGAPEPPAGSIGVTVIHPGAANPARRWPPERFAAVAAAEASAGRRVVVTGAREEAGLAAEVVRRAGLPALADQAGRTGLLELAALVAVADRVVCGDTGIAHLATALRTPSVVLFGPTSPAEWGPPPERPAHRVLWAGSTGDPHAASPDPGLLSIRVGDVLAALDELEDGSLALRSPGAASPRGCCPPGP